MRALRDFLNRTSSYALALAVHVAVAGVLMVNVRWPGVDHRSAPEAASAIQATVVDEERVQRELQVIRDRETEKRREEEERIEAARRQREHEESRLEEARRLRQTEEDQGRQEAERLRQEREALEKERNRIESEHQRLLTLVAETEQARLEEERRRDEAMKARLEEERRHDEAEEKRRQEAERVRREEELQMARRRAEEARRAEAERQRQVEERARRELMAREEQRLEQERKAIFAKALEEYIAAIESSVVRNWRRPTGVPGGLKCTVNVVQANDGEVLKVEITQSSGNVAFDRSVEQAVLAASPLPLPRQQAVFDREIVFLFNPRS